MTASEDTMSNGLLVLMIMVGALGVLAIRQSQPGRTVAQARQIVRFRRRS